MAYIVLTTVSEAGTRVKRGGPPVPPWDGFRPKPLTPRALAPAVADVLA
jgi:hypothetical protein